MMTSSQHFMIVAGEVSGDSHASALVSALKALRPTATFSGLGGPQMQAAGVSIDEDFTKFAVVGFSEIIKHYPSFKRCFDLFLKMAAQRKPTAVILVDYPGFNLRLAKQLKKLGIPVIYYISPQVWAWKENRVEFIRKYVDRMIVLFKFEKQFYAERGIEVDFAGHPLMDKIHLTASKDQILKQTGLTEGRTTIGLLPGSRQKEIENLLPPMLDAAMILHGQDPAVQFLLLKAPNLAPELFEKFLTNNNLPLRISACQFHDSLNVCDVCIVASGTAALETALLLKPMVVVYKTSFLTYILAKALIKIPYISLVNIIAGKKIIAECIQNDATGTKIAEEITKIYKDPSVFERIIIELKNISSSLGSGGASKRAAENILKFLDRSK